MTSTALDLIPDSSRQMADIATDLAVQSRNLYEQFFQISLEEHPEYGQRASRVFCQASWQRDDWLMEMHESIINNLLELTNQSVIRNFMRIYTKGYLPEDEGTLGKLVAYSFDALEKPNRTIAIDAYAMTILAKVAKGIPELKDELIAILTNKLDDESMGVSSRARLLIKELKYQS